MALAAYYAKLVYNANGGSGAPAAQSAYSDEPGASVYVILGAAPSRQYYTFKGWAPSSSASSGRTPGGKYYMTTSTTLYAANARIYNLYATWQRNTVLIGYDPNGGSGSAWYQTVNQGEQITLSSTVPTRTGYKFLGWATSATATAPAYQAGGKATFTRETRLYAVWEISNSTISSITGSVPIDGATQGSVSISAINNAYTHELTISIGNSSQVISLAAGVTSANFTIPASWLAEVPNSTTGTARASLNTFNGSTQIGGADVKTFSITVPSSVVPSVSVSTDYVNSNSVVEGWDILLQNYSQIKLTATVAGGTGASVSNIAFSGDGLSQTGSSNVATSAVLTSSGSRSWTVTVTDSRGRTVSTVVTDTVHEYFSPSIESLLAFRSDSSGNRDDAAGTYLKATGVFSYASADGNNTLSVDVIEYQAEDASGWTVGANNVASGSPYVFGGGLITETKLFHVRLSLADALGNSAQYVVDVSPIVGYGFGLLNDRVHFGGPCKEKGFVCDFPTKLVKGHIVGSHSASGNYAKVVTFSTNVQASRNLLYFVNNVVQESNGITLTTHKDGSITITGTASANTNLNLDFGNAGQATFEEIDNGTTYYWSAVVLSGTITGTTPIIRGGYYGDAVAQSSAHTVGANSCVSSTVPSSGTYYARTYIHFDSGTKFEDVVIGVMMTLNNVSAYADYEPYVDATNMDVNKPLTVEYIRTGDTSPTELTIGFTSNYSLDSFTSNNSLDAYLHLAGTAKWILYIGKSSSSDSVEILDFHNPWSNTDMTIEWEDTSISTLPTGATQAESVNTNIDVNANAVSVSNGTWTNTGSITLTKGTWIITAFSQFATNTTGRRQALISETSASSTSVRGMMTDNQAPVDGAVTLCRFMDIYTVTSATKTLYLNSYQNSGSTMNVYGRIYAIKIV